MLSTTGEPPPNCSRQGGGRSFLASSRAWLPRRRSRRVFVPVYVHVVCVCIYYCMYMYVRTCIYVYICMCIRMHVYTRVYGHRLWISVVVPQRVGQCRGCTCVFVCICIRMHMCICIYIFTFTYMCAFFCNKCCVHFGPGFLGTSACAGVDVTQVFVWHQRTHLQHTRCRVRTYVCIYIL